MKEVIKIFKPAPYTVLVFTMNLFATIFIGVSPVPLIEKEILIALILIFYGIYAYIRGRANQLDDLVKRAQKELDFMREQEGDAVDIL